MAKDKLDLETMKKEYENMLIKWARLGQIWPYALSWAWFEEKLKAYGEQQYRKGIDALAERLVQYYLIATDEEKGLLKAFVIGLKEEQLKDE